MTDAVETRLYVRLAPTTLFLAPLCYGCYKEHDVSEKCRLCPVKKHCVAGQPVEERVV